MKPSCIKKIDIYIYIYILDDDELDSSLIQF